MLYRIFQYVNDDLLDKPLAIFGDKPATWRQIRSRADEFVAKLSPHAGRAIGLAVSFGCDWLAAAAAADFLGCRSFLLPAELSAEQLSRYGDQFDLAAVLVEADHLSADDRTRKLDDLSDTCSTPAQAHAGQSSVVLLTSGTSGEPKAALHSWTSLASGIRAGEKLRGVRMLLAYDVTRYAGLQVLLTALLNAAVLCVPRSRAMPDVVRAVVDQRVDVVSGTPTFWRMLLANSSPADRASMQLRQITLGGEPVDQHVLDGLRSAFPAARITHIYASTEMGVCFSVHDAREGFPADFLNSDKLPVRLKIESGRLWIRSNRGMAGYLGRQTSGDMAAGEWFDTGDAVELRGDRVLFLGRLSSRINVGGEKVYPEEIESIIRQVPGVADARVSGLASTIVGQLVQAEVVPADGADTAELSQRISEFCRGRLDGFKRPRIISFVETLASPDTMKISRRTDGT